MITIKFRITSKIAIMIKITSKASQERNSEEFCKICAAQASTRPSKSSLVRLLQNSCSLGQHKAIQEQIRAECCKICAA